MSVCLLYIYMKTIDEIQNTPYQQIVKESTQTLRDYIVEVSNQAQTEGRPVEDLIDEGLLSALVGGVVGGAAGKTVMEAVCKALGVKEDSTLGKLLTSRMVLTAVGTYLGYKW